MTSFDPITAFMVVVGATSEHLPTGVATLSREAHDHIVIAVSMSIRDASKHREFKRHIYNAGFFLRNASLVPTTSIRRSLLTAEVLPLSALSQDQPAGPTPTGFAAG